ncbi:hypothetical protein [Kordiimonas marina]|uniref:hypothetical protein n=1 Tax=Kordiimonas marina TaxID=2872312 RepID=UPI001FF1CE31|nr:hypothetical protein [Kordiimonas marina]MCJ9430431.1 hypothetical protein [Kordiimonas marina]
MREKRQFMAIPLHAADRRAFSLIVKLIKFCADAFGLHRRAGEKPRAAQMENRDFFDKK